MEEEGEAGEEAPDIKLSEEDEAALEVHLPGAVVPSSVVPVTTRPVCTWMLLQVHMHMSRGCACCFRLRVGLLLGDRA